MVKKPILDLLPRNMEFHNLSHVNLTDTQSRTLGLGLKFRPTLRPPTARAFDCQVQDFCRSVRLHYKYSNQPDDPDFNPKLYVKSGWNPPREDPNLEESLYSIRQDLLENFNNNKPRWRNNLSPEERSGLREIKENPTVRVLATDKNLGPALISTEWVEKETLKHLNDTKSYSKVTLDDWTFRRHKVIETREKLVQSYSHFLPPNSHKFLRSLDDNSQSLNPAKFYIIPKIHKSPIAGRPIAASHSFITRPISIFVDELVKPSISMPTVLRDSGELIQCLGGIKLPADCLLVTADVSSLYPNIDTKKAIIALDLLLREGKVAQTPLLVQFTRLVFDNNFLQSEFSRDIYHQTYGIAMGTPFAVTAANAFMYYHERDIIELYAQHLTLYKRFIDDIFVIWDGTRETLLEFLSAMNAKDERIKLTYEISDSKIPFLDLLLFKDSASHTLQHSTFQKPLNKYLYIPFESFHPTSNKKAFIKGELMRFTGQSPTQYQCSRK
ncbi:uncharacterized protein LOC141860796 [Acropora palmata]|uniref:uncharacterized protein LOC141860796 n=1 Tax=Acropora palmata TaxID=6131 RepID=UPI003DA01B87